MKVSNSSLHDSLVFEKIYIHDKNLPANADAAYKCKRIEEFIKNNGYQSEIQFKRSQSKKLPLYKKIINKINSISRVVVDHGFARYKSYINLFIRSIEL